MKKTIVKTWSRSQINKFGSPITNPAPRPALLRRASWGLCPLPPDPREPRTPTGWQPSHGYLSESSPRLRQSLIVIHSPFSQLGLASPSRTPDATWACSHVQIGLGRSMAELVGICVVEGPKPVRRGGQIRRQCETAGSKARQLVHFGMDQASWPEDLQVLLQMEGWCAR